MSTSVVIRCKIGTCSHFSSPRDGASRARSLSFNSSWLALFSVRVSPPQPFLPFCVNFPRACGQPALRCAAPQRHCAVCPFPSVADYRPQSRCRLRCGVACHATAAAMHRTRPPQAMIKPSWATLCLSFVVLFAAQHVAVVSARADARRGSAPDHSYGNPGSGGVVHPVIFVPGLGGSVLEAKLSNRTKHRDCATTSDWYTLWFSETQVLTRYECFIENIKLSINATSNELLNPRGVKVRGRDFGGMDGVNYANAGSHDVIPVPYLVKLSDVLEKQLGYIAGKTLRAATYDFRKAGQDADTQQMFARLQQLVEETYQLQGNRSIHLVGHSLGCNFANSFLLSKSAAWKKQFIASLIILSPPLAGTPVAIQGTIAGPVFPYVPQEIPALVAPAVRTMASIGWMFPHENASIWNPNTTFIQTNKRNYTIGDIPDVLEAMNATVLKRLWPSLKRRHVQGFIPPEVPVLCMYANDSKTALTIEMENVFDVTGKIVASTLGDGTVNIDSLRVCNHWKALSAAPVVVREHALGGSLSAHTDIVQSEPVLRDIVAWLRSTPAAEVAPRVGPPARTAGRVQKI